LFCTVYKGLRLRQQKTLVTSFDVTGFYRLGQR
jgi:hypothetical protein